MRYPWQRALALCSGLVILAAATASGQTSGQAAAPATQVFPLTDTKDLTAYKVKLEAVEYQGRKAVH
jgi:hypothetical protein